MTTDTKHALPIGAVVIYTAPECYEAPENRARLVIVEHSHDCDGSPLYMAAERPIVPPPANHKLYSMGYLAYRLHAGWFVGNAPLSCFEDTGRRVRVEKFDVERYRPEPS